MVPLNVPNLLTVVRILLVPVLVVALLDNTGGGDLLAAIVFAVASVTDAIDGYLARSRGSVTTFGKLMDPNRGQAVDRRRAGGARLARAA
jgi:CDP-diacylglycerol---glycerol-3-phosphate 3-phosphatidyltransferase